MLHSDPWKRPALKDHLYMRERGSKMKMSRRNRLPLQVLFERQGEYKQYEQIKFS